MSALAILLVGLGGYLMYYAFRNQTVTPVVHAQQSLTGLTAKAA